MNLFILDEDIEFNVKYHVDNHVNKIALEALQLLSNALWLQGHPDVAYDASMWYKAGAWNTPQRASLVRAYGPTHLGSPLSKWCADPVNYMWTLRYAVELCKEHQYRKGTIIQQWRVLSQLPRFTVNRMPVQWYCAVNDNLMTAAELAAGKMVTMSRAIEVYRQYYRTDKAHLHAWTARPEPEWLKPLSVG